MLAHVAWRQALSGDPRMLREALKRFWPMADAAHAEADEGLAGQLDATAKRLGEDL